MRTLLFRTLLVFADLTGASTLGQARDTPPVAGPARHYAGRGDGFVELDLYPFQRGEKGILYKVELSTSIKNQCSGFLKVKEAKMEKSRYMSLNPDTNCKITLSFANGFSTVRVKAAPGCSDYHGPACAFDGVLRRR